MPLHICMILPVKLKLPCVSHFFLLHHPCHVMTLMSLSYHHAYHQQQ